MHYFPAACRGERWRNGSRRRWNGRWWGSNKLVSLYISFISEIVFFKFTKDSTSLLEVQRAHSPPLQSSCLKIAIMPLTHVHPYSLYLQACTVQLPWLVHLQFVVKGTGEAGSPTTPTRCKAKGMEQEIIEACTVLHSGIPMDSWDCMDSWNLYKGVSYRPGEHLSESRMSSRGF